MKLFWIAGAFAAMCLSGCSAPVSSANADTTPLEHKPVWYQVNETDEMTGKPFHSLSLKSAEQFPDFAGTEPKATQLTIIHRNGRDEVTIENKNLQLLCGEYHEPLKVKFDNGPVQRFPCSEASTHNYGFGFIDSPARFVAGVRKAKTLTIQAEVYDRGVYTMHWTLPDTFPMGGVTKAADKPVPGHKNGRAKVASAAPAEAPTLVSPPTKTEVSGPPVFFRKPSAEDIARYYPDRAQRMGISGSAKINCTLMASGSVGGCSVVSESPADAGFGEAALHMSRLIRAHATTEQPFTYTFEFSPPRD